MPAPSVRYKILPARGDISALTAAIAAIDEGELCYALDEDQLYVKEGGVLVPAGIEEAPQDGIQYVRKDGEWEAVDVPPGTIIGTSADLPAEVEQGQQWYDTDSGRLFVYTGTEWVDASPDGGYATCTTSDDAPANASDGDLWYRTTDGRMYVYYEDSDSSQWVDANPNLPPASDTFERSGTTVSLVNSGDTVNLSGDLTVDTSTLHVDSANNRVGIGTDSPGAKLEVSGSDQTNTIIRSTGNASSSVRFINTTNADVYAGSSGGDFRVLTSGNEAMRIDSSGKVGIGTDDPLTPLHVVGDIRGSNLAGSGNRAVYSAASGTLTNSSSDGSLKTNVTTLDSQLEVVKQLNPISFNWIDTEERGEQLEIGFIAQEVQPLVPEVVGTNSDGTLTVDYPKMVATLTSALQEALIKIEDLEARLDDAGL